MRILARYDLWLCAALLWGATFCAAFSVITLLRLPLGLVAVLFVPGYLVQAVLFPRPTGLTPISRLSYSLSFSLGLVLVIGLILNFTTGLETLYLLMTLTACGMLIIWLVWWRRTTHEEERVISPAMALPAPKRNAGLLLTIMLLCIGELVLLMLFLLVVAPANDNLTEFYILDPATRQAEKFPQSAKTGEPINVVLGIANREGRTQEYRVEILINGQAGGNTGGWRINPNAKLEVNLTFVPRISGEKVPVLFRLYRSGDSKPFRTLRLIIPAII